MNVSFNGIEKHKICGTNKWSKNDTGITSGLKAAS